HRMRREPDLTGDAKPLGLGFDAAFECDAVVRAERFDAVEPFQKIEMPHGAPEFAICGAAQADIRLARDHTLDSGVFHGAQIYSGNLAAFVARASVFEYRRTQQAANVVSAKRRVVTLQMFSPGSSDGNPV